MLQLKELIIVDMNIAKEKKHGKTRRFIVLKGLASLAHGSKYAALTSKG